MSAPRRPRGRTVPAAAAALTALAAGLLCATGVAAGGTAPAPRLQGTFAMTARVTTAVRVRGEHRGQVLHRVWVFVPERCSASGCRSARLIRQRGRDFHARLTLHRTASGSYEGSGSFYVALRCRGRRYPHGSRVPYTISVRIAGTTTVGTVPYATAVTGTYLNRRRTDSTPCPLGPSHDAAAYTGTVTAGLPAPPPATTAPAAATTPAAPDLRAQG